MQTTDQNTDTPPRISDKPLLCPNCHNNLIRMQLSSVEVDHCHSCGGTLFDYNEINRITLSDAQKLALLKQSDNISGDEKLSPNDGSPLKRIDDEAIPPFVTLLKSDTTGEVFAFADDLINFKNAQSSKMSFFSSWHMPIPALKSVLVLSFIMALGISSILITSRLGNQNSTSIQAGNLCTNGIEVFRSSDGPSDDTRTGIPYAVSCTTTSEITCSVVAQCDEGFRSIILTNTPTRIQAGLIPADCSQIKLVCDDKNTTLETEWTPLQ